MKGDSLVGGETIVRGAAPRVTVLMPVFNAAPFLPSAVESVLNQSFGDFELLAINDGSTDQSGEILARYAAGDARMRVLKQANRGLVATLNIGLAMARGEYVARMDADDVSLPQRFAKQVAFLDSHSHVVVVGGAAICLNKEGVLGELLEYPCEPEVIRQTLAKYCPLVHPAVMMRGRAVIEAGGYRGAFANSQDYDLWVRLSEKYDLANLPDVILHYRTHTGQESVRSMCRQAICALAVRASAAARGRTGRDPADSLRSVDFEALESMGMFRPESELLLIQMVEERIWKLRKRGTADQIWSIVDELRNTLGPAATRRGRAALDYLVARLAWSQGKTLRTLAMAARACMLHPGYLFGFLRTGKGP